MSSNSHITLKQQLDQLAKKGVAHLSRLRNREAIETAWPQAIKYALGLPLLVLIISLISVLTGGKPMSIWVLLLSTLASPIVNFVGFYLKALTTVTIDRRVSLAFYDKTLNSKDRIQTTDEFLKIEQPKEFESAAIADGQKAIEEALKTPLPNVELTSAKLDNSYWKQGLLAFVPIILMVLAQAFTFSPSSSTTAEVEQNLIAKVNVNKELTEEAEEDNFSTNKRQASKPKTQKKTNSSNNASSEPMTAQKSKPGTPKAASQAQDQEGAAKQNQSGNSGAGASSQSSGSKDKKKKKEKPAGKQKKKTEAKDQEAKEQEKNSAAGVANGKGNTSGQQPANSDKAAAENKARQEDEGDNTDEAEEEEDEEQKANSSMGPKKNKRKAPADRKLSISGVSDQENEDANGRGGPGGLKKTRGVAAMLLGVPMPDRLQGTPNPGRTKSIQEQAQPEQEVVERVVGQSRGQNNGNLGQVPEQDLLPWLKEVVKDYFLNQRADNKQATN